jgi:diguanylate cyclase (GGDEF)-like protein
VAVISLFNSLQHSTASTFAQTAVDCYRRVLASLANHAVEAQAEPTAAHRAALHALAQQLSKPSAESLEDTCASLDRELARWSAHVRGYQDDRERELREILALTGEATTVVTAQNDQYTERLRTFGQHLQTLSRQGSLTEVRRGLNHQVSTLRTCMEEMRKQSESAVLRLEGQMQQFQERLAAAEQLAATDALTGVLNRRGAEGRLAQLTERASPFVVLLFDVNRFKQVNDTWGHAAGDQVLRGFADRLRQVLRPGDILCRWGGDEFLALLPSALPISDERLEQIKHRTRGFYKISTMGKDIQVDVSASVGRAQYQPGESVEDLIARADNELYRHKQYR